MCIAGRLDGRASHIAECTEFLLYTFRVPCVSMSWCAKKYTHGPREGWMDGSFVRSVPFGRTGGGGGGVDQGAESQASGVRLLHGAVGPEEVDRDRLRPHMHAHQCSLVAETESPEIKIAK